jgi:hypothetical protein
MDGLREDFDMESDLGCEKQRQVSGKKDLGAFTAARPSHSGKLPVALGGTNDVLRRFNSETGWLAARLITFAIIAALALAAQEWYQDATDHATEERLARDDALLNGNPSALLHVRSVNSESASIEIPSGQIISVDPTASPISPQQNPSPQTQSQEPIQAPVPTLTSAVNQLDPHSNFDPASSVHGQDRNKEPQFKVQAIHAAQIR